MIRECALNLRKTPETSARRQSMKAVRPVIVSNGNPNLQMRSVGSHNTPGKEKEGKDRVAQIKSDSFAYLCFWLEVSNSQGSGMLVSGHLQ